MSRLGFGAAKPPVPSGLGRRFRKRELTSLIDEITGKNAIVTGNPTDDMLNALDTGVTVDFQNLEPSLLEYKIFNKSDRTIWKASAGSGTVWQMNQLNQEFIYDNIQDAYKYILWIKVSNNIIKDILMYSNALTGDDVCIAKNYVGVGETLDIIEGNTLICKKDIIT